MTRKKLAKKNNALVKKSVGKAQREQKFQWPNSGQAQHPSLPDDTVYLHKGVLHQSLSPQL